MYARFSTGCLQGRAIFRWLVVAMMFVLAAPVFAETVFQNYVMRCRDELAFDSIPSFDCRGVNFRPRTQEKYFQQTNDWVAYRRVNAVVDAVFACRWVQNDEGPSRAASGEMIVHNRQTGGTCFFELKSQENAGALGVPSTKPVSPTNAKADSAWEELGKFNKLGNKVCTTCHAAGPYIASPQIAGALARFGLLNNGHDTRNERYYVIVPGSEYFTAVAKARFRDPIDGALPVACAAACHVIANKPYLDANCRSGHQQWPLCESPNNVNAILMPSINVVIDDIAKMKTVMPPTKASSDYRWINSGSPFVSSIDRENAQILRRVYPTLTCDNPSYMQARRVDHGVILSSNDLPDYPDRIEYFNLQDGLVCKNPGRPTTTCRDYETRYKCDGEWTAWKNSPSNPSGDFEQRSKFTGCAKPTDIQARFREGGEYKVVYGPRDRLAAFTHKALECRNWDQDNGQCSNYTVRFFCN